MASLFIRRLEEALNSTESDTINIPSVAAQVVSKYYLEEKTMMKTMNRLRLVDLELKNEEMSLWTVLCAQVLMLMLMSKKLSKDDKDKLVEGINETLKKFDDIEEYNSESHPVKN